MATERKPGIKEARISPVVRIITRLKPINTASWQFEEQPPREAPYGDRVSATDMLANYTIFSLLFFVLLAVGKDSTRSAILINRTQGKNEGVQKKYWYDDVKLGMGGKEADR